MSKPMSNPVVIILLTAVAVAAIILVIVFTVRLAQNPRNTLVGGGVGPELVQRVLELKATDQFDQAVFLVRGETGMSHRAAARFVRRLKAPPME
ncbi:uncharacterized protein YpmB [Streptosporangium becharense]|uniref:Uncharacterized protein YpmB n=1 Tax=Streptosporangium becharense TaxID=1816182 RepID=A0A7W9IMV9_9ACTN|nr:hypothetical protein [Streptosporangium becharense]MBB2914296.1 uncharacterized protein YpmB [Streptosporangium becharense]MBB5823672.1 uncharacterized protein YpmB [Streptosporangium becharense]